VTDLGAIARPSGAFAMVAMDQRESLRTMLGGRASDARMTAFKLAVARALGPLASGFLIDRQYGFDQVRRAALLPPSCGLILAVDALVQEPDEPVTDTFLDPPGPDLTGVAALKLLVIWRDDDRRAARVEMARRFVELAAARGVLSVLEPVAPSMSEALDAARTLGPLRPSLYKAQVPERGRGSAAELRSACARLAEAIGGPWVVLSQGVDRDDFRPAVEAACRGGASGFLAGRALWSDLVDRPGDLPEVAVPRLARLIETVDEFARPWTAA
jgi:sulfofructosephosphate aldolase